MFLIAKWKKFLLLLVNLLVINWHQE
jgi:hypothetical protein